MKARDLITELRRGNLIYGRDTWKKEKAVVEVEDIMEDRINPTILDGCLDLWVENPEPVPITKEWLIKLGYQKDEQDLYYYDSGGDFAGEFVVRFYKDDIDIAPFANRNPKPDYIFEHISIQYVHQLQNLYFALTGEELTIKELTK